MVLFKKSVHVIAFNCVLMLTGIMLKHVSSKLRGPGVSTFHILGVISSSSSISHQLDSLPLLRAIVRHR